MSEPSVKRENAPGPSQVKKKDEGDKKPNEGRKFAKISAESIKMMSEAAGILGFTDEMANKISEDVTYRLREVLHHASIFLRHSRRKKLLPRDIEEVLEDYDVPPVFGHSASKKVDLVHLEELDLFVFNDEEEDLVAQALENKDLFQLGDPVIKDYKVSPTVQETAQQSEPQVVIKQEDAGPSTSKPEETSNKPKLPPHLLTYYNRIGSVLLGDSKTHFEVVMADLLINNKIGPIVPFLLNLMAMSLQKIPNKRTKFLHAVLVLTYNRGIELSCCVSVHRLVSALLMCALETKAIEDVSKNDEFHVKSVAALVLSKVVGSWCQGESKLHLEIVQKLGAVLLNGSSPLKSHYGALACLVAFGSEALEYCLWPHLGQYLSFLEAKPLDQEVREVEGAILNAAETLYRLEWTRLSDPSTLPQGILFVDRLLECYFGDTLCSRWTHVTLNANNSYLSATGMVGRRVSKAKVRKSSSLLTCSDGTNPTKEKKCPVESQDEARFVPKLQIMHVTKQYSLSDVFDLSMTGESCNFTSNATGIEMNFAGGKPVPQARLFRRGVDQLHRHFTVPTPYFTKSCEAGCVGQRKIGPRRSQAHLKLCAFRSNKDILMVL